MNSHCVDVNDLTLLGPTRNTVMQLFDVYSNYAHDHYSIFNLSKTTCLHFPCHRGIFYRKGIIISVTASLVCMYTSIVAQSFFILGYQVYVVRYICGMGIMLFPPQTSTPPPPPPPQTILFFTTLTPIHR